MENDMQDIQADLPTRLDGQPEGYADAEVNYEAAALPDVLPVPPAAPSRRSRLRGLIRIGLILLALLIVLIVAGAVIFSLVKSSHNQPLTIDAYPNATVLTNMTAASSDHVVYQSDDPIDIVYDFYSRRLGSSAESGCKKLYLDTVASEAPGHYYYRCVVDSSVLEVTQLATLTITYQSPPEGVKNRTLIDVSRSWGG